MGKDKNGERANDDQDLFFRIIDRFCALFMISELLSIWRKSNSAI